MKHVVRDLSKFTNDIEATIIKYPEVNKGRTCENSDQMTKEGILINNRNNMTPQVYKGEKKNGAASGKSRFPDK